MAKNRNVSGKALRVVSKIVEDMPEKDKEGIFASIMSNKNARDHILKIILWTYCSKDVLKDVNRREDFRSVVERIEQKQREREKARPPPAEEDDIEEW